MKVRIPLVVDVDPQLWAAANGQVVDAAGKFKLTDVREDIRSYFLNLVQSAPMVDETDAEVSL